MSQAAVSQWYRANQRYLNASLALVRHALARHGAESGEAAEAVESGARAGLEERTGDDERLAALRLELQEAQESVPGPSALETLCAAFGLSDFERDILLMCAGMELDSTFAPLCAGAQGESAREYPTFSLALAALKEAHWTALTPSAPLRRWRLIEIGVGARHALTLSPLRIDERVLHYLAGVQQMDERLSSLVQTLEHTDALVPTHLALADQIMNAWSQAMSGSSELPVIQLCGPETKSKRDIAATTYAALGLGGYVLSSALIPQDAGELDTLVRLWEREALLGNSAVLLDCDEAATPGAEPARNQSALVRLIERVRAPLMIASREPLRGINRAVLTFDVNKPPLSEQRAVWESALGSSGADLNGHIDALVSQFNLSASAIRSATLETVGRGVGPDELGRELWQACRAQARRRFDDLAERIEPVAQWQDLVLPETARQVLRDIAAHVRQRTRVYEAWGFRAKSTRGLGISALFAGVSGTGKTLAAEVLAAELKLDLYRIDLSQVVSKYIGETEKNLRRIFDAAEEGGIILLFDEADALFGKRSEVKDSHDRYANIEVSYLLQKMEAYRGLAILTTNLKSALDTAFLRRLRFIVQFPFPDIEQRSEIWRRIFPADTPTEHLDIDRLAQLSVAGGSIRNIALNAAFFAADGGESVGMAHLLRAARGEYAKLEKTLTETETGGW